MPLSLARAVALAIAWASGSLVPTSSQGAPLSEMMCHATAATIIDGKTLQAVKTEWTDNYRFSGGSLFITHPGGSEYLFGNPLIEDTA